MGLFSKPRRPSAAPSEQTAVESYGYTNSYDPEQAKHETDPVQSETVVEAEGGWKGKKDPFADEGDGESQTKFRTMAWWQAGMIMIAETISLGILSLPSVLAAVGFAPGMILIFGLGAIATYTGYVIGQFKLRYPHVHNMADAGMIFHLPDTMLEAND